MKEPVTEREIWLSILYAILLVPIAFLFNLAFGWLFDNVLISLINWFNHLNLFLKILLFFFEGVIVLVLIIGLFKAIGNVICFLIFGKLPDNWFTIIFSIVIYLGSVILSMIALWNATPKFNFWIFLEFVLLAISILSVNTILMPWWFKEKMDKQKRQRLYEEMMFKKED